MSVSSEVQIEQLSINTIRTLSMDAVQAAKSGHPGTPMALAPVAYHTVAAMCCGYDPDAPHWPARDRFVLSCGHASMLLYSMLHLAGVKQLDADGKPTGELAVLARSDQAVSPTAQPLPRPSGSERHDGRRNHDRPAGPRLRQQRRHGDRPALAGRSFQSAGLRAVRLQCLRSVQRRRHDGRHLERSRVDRRASEALEPLLDLRRQSHHDRRQHEAGLRRRRRPPLRGARLACDARRRRQRSRRARRRLQIVRGNRRPADDDHRPQSYRLRFAEQARHEQGARRSRSAKKKSS